MKRYIIFGMTLVLLVAAGLRLGALPDLPVGLHYDEAANVILARQIASGDYRPVFIRAYTGKEVLFFYSGAFWVWATGGAPWGLRLNAAMLGIVTVAATFAATHALLGPAKHSWEISLLAAGWVAVAFPHVLLSRYGFRAISQPLLQALTVATLWRGLRNGKRAWLIASGVGLGLTGYTYLAARLFPLPLTFAMGWLLLRAPEKARQRIAQLGLVLLAAVIVFAPLGLYFLRNPDAFTTRIAQVASPTWRDALRGLWLCLRAAVWPGAGDPYIRFNIPGKPLLDVLSAALAVIGLARLLFSWQGDDLHRAGRTFIIAVLVTMLLPSALATTEITPSNLRLAGLFPFIAILPAYGVVTLADTLERRFLPRGFSFLPLASCFLLLLTLGGSSTAHAYRCWATSRELFYAADGEMTLAAKVLDATDLSHTTVYIASEHYRHPTAAALAQQYAQAKWLTGGATLVLPPSGDAVYVWPNSLTPPASWPDTITAKWRTTVLSDPIGEPALLVKRLVEADVAALRTASTAPKLAADFAHVIQLYDAQPAGECRVAAPCPIFITWAVDAPYTTLQPVVRLLHPETGEWTRETAFHYPPADWTVGDLLLDQFTLTPPVGIPPVDGYEIGVSFFNPDGGEVLPRLVTERFAGLEARFPLTGTLLPMTSAPDAAQVAACPGIPRETGAAHGDLRLEGVMPLPGCMRPGESLFLRLCWQATGAALPEGDVTLTLQGPETRILYEGTPASGYAFAQWRPGDIIEDRYTLRLPRETAAGLYTLALSVGKMRVATLGTVEVQTVMRSFAPPKMQHPFVADFGAHIRLLGYDVGTLRAGQPLDVTLYWQSLAELDDDYLVFVHVLDEAGTVVTQVDEAPQQDGYPTSLWIAGEIVTDRHTLNLPGDLPEGDYRLRVGFYRQENGDYLAVNGDTHILLPVIGPH